MIDTSFGSFDNFKREFSAAAAGHFGSGWAWLVLDKKDGKLKVTQTHDAGSPIEGGFELSARIGSALDQQLSPISIFPDANHHPLLTCDVWEHAYVSFVLDRSSILCERANPRSRFSHQYIDYRNARPSYIESWWKLANWEFAAQQLSSAQKA